jgi:hypothetical protein
MNPLPALKAYIRIHFMKMTPRKILLKCFFTLLAVLLLLPGVVWTEEPPPLYLEPTLVKAVMCENIHKFSPVNDAVVFSMKLGRIYCFTEFDPVPKQTIIYHKWYHNGNLVSVKQLTVNPPRWSSISSVQLRDADKGVWQVDVTDANDKFYRTLRFSITD